MTQLSLQQATDLATRALRQAGASEAMAISTAKALVLAEAQGETNKARLRRVGEEAQARGIFGAPTFVADDREVFWGNDRLERALEWAVAHGRRSDWPI